MNNEQRSCLIRDSELDCLGRDIIGLGIDVGKDRHRAALPYDVCGRYERMRGRDHLIARAHAGSKQGEMERDRAIGYRARVFRAG